MKNKKEKGLKKNYWPSKEDRDLIRLCNHIGIITYVEFVDGKMFIYGEYRGVKEIYPIQVENPTQLTHAHIAALRYFFKIHKVTGSIQAPKNKDVQSDVKKNPLSGRQSSIF